MSSCRTFLDAVDDHLPCPQCQDYRRKEDVAGDATVKSVKCDDEVNHPAHYNSHPSGVECIQITEHLNFNLGNATKYLWRASLKGKQAQDLEKAIWYIQREIARLGHV